jgi:hypothetical protein
MQASADANDNAAARQFLTNGDLQIAPDLQGGYVAVCQQTHEALAVVEVGCDEARLWCFVGISLLLNHTLFEGHKTTSNRLADHTLSGWAMSACGL